MAREYDPLSFAFGRPEKNRMIAVKKSNNL